MARLAFDTAGRITLPETLCDQFAITDDVILVGLGQRFQIWPRAAFNEHRATQRAFARENLPAFRTQQRLARAAAAS
jgi:MraZ protein